MRALTDEQERAVALRERSLLLAAGAGSGKTSVLVERFVRAVLEDGVAPGRILAITFTERSAGELRERIRARFLELGQREAARDTEGAFVSTFHGFCARLLRSHPLQAGVEPGFQILEEGMAGRLRMLAFSDALGGFLDDERSDAVDLVAAYGADPLRALIFGAYAQLRSQGQSEPRLPTACHGEPRLAAVARDPETEQAAHACALIGELVERFGDAYSQRKHTRAALDFDDLELRARTLLEQRADVREMWAERLLMLMVDEFQDTNPRQLEILAALERDNLFTVGDELQSIYGFRHADIGLFRARGAQLAERGGSLALTCNFRSRPAILAAVERIFAGRMGEHFAPLRAGREEESAGREEESAERDEETSGERHGETQRVEQSRATQGEPLVELLLTDRCGWERVPGDSDLAGLPDATPWRQAEARLLAARIAELISSRQAHAGEVVVLLRALGDLPVYESALRRHGLRTLAGVGGFWSHQQVCDLLAWLRALANPLDELALYSALASPLVGISSDGLALLARVAREQRATVWQTVVESAQELDRVMPEQDRERLRAFREIFLAERSTVPLHPLATLIRRAVSTTGYEAHVRSLAWGDRRMANVHKLVRLARRYEAQEGRDLRGFLDHVAHLEDAQGAGEADAPVAGGELDAVRLMSIHAAKGLEFAVVCVADLGRAPNLKVPDLLVDGPSARVGLRLLRLGDTDARGTLDFEELRDASQDAQAQEEDRILYVACTRARDRLLLGGAVDFGRWPQIRPGVAPVAWLAPALVPDAPKLAESVAQTGEGVDANEARGSGCRRSELTIDLGAEMLVRLVLNAPDSEGERLIASPSQQVEDEPGVRRRAEESLAPVGQVEDGITGRRQVEDGIVVAGRAVLRGEPAPTPFADPDGTMSYTSLAELERCGYRFYAERVLRLAENHAAARGNDDDGGIEARTRGTIVHALLEAIDFSRLRMPSADEVERLTRRLGASAGAREREEIRTLVATALRAEPTERLALARQARAEHAFAFSLGPEQPLVTGVLDLIVQEADGTSLIVDYKSDRLEGGEDLEQLVERDYGFQRMIYALAAIEDGAVEVEVAHWFLERPGEWVAMRFGANRREELRERLLVRVQRARARGFVVTEQPHRGICLTCPARGGLCSWGETRTMGARLATLESDR